MEVEKAFGARTEPDQGIEGREKRRCRYRSWGLRFDVEIGGISPSLHPDWPQTACLDQFDDSEARVFRRHSIVIGQVGCCPDAMGSCGTIDEFALGVFA